MDRPAGDFDPYPKQWDSHILTYQKVEVVLIIAEFHWDDFVTDLSTCLGLSYA